jgi:hypothetical protein
MRRVCVCVCVCVCVRVYSLSCIPHAVLVPCLSPSLTSSLSSPPPPLSLALPLSLPALCLSTSLPPSLPLPGYPLPLALRSVALTEERLDGLD